MKIPFDSHEKLSEEDRDAAVGAAMVIHGGGFMKAIGRALLYANASETRKLKEAFPREWNEYAALAGIEA